MNEKILIAGIVGIAAVGIGAYALTRNSNSQQQSTNNDAFSGFTGGGATGDYSKPTIAEQISNVLEGLGSSQPTMAMPEMESTQNPSDEVADVKQMSYVGNPVTYVGSNLAQAMSALGTTSTPSMLHDVAKDQNTSQKTTAAEYNQGNSFTPAPKQADMSSYNQEKTGGNTANTPKQTSEKSSETRISSKEEGHAALAATKGPLDAAIQGVGGLLGWW